MKRYTIIHRNRKTGHFVQHGPETDDWQRALRWRVLDDANDPDTITTIRDNLQR